MTQTSKTCFKCRVPKPLTAFYAHPGMADGHFGKCKECMKADVKKNRKDKIEQYTQYEKQRAQQPHRIEARKEYAATPEGREAGNRAKRAWEARNPEKKKAATAVSNAVRDGKLVRGKNCQVCGSDRNIEAHHEDYSKPFEIVWLCKKHHWQADEKRRLLESEFHIPEYETVQDSPERRAV